MKKYHLLIFLSHWLCVNQLTAQVNLVLNPGFEEVECLTFKIKNWEIQGAGIPANTCFPIIPSPGPSFTVPYLNPNRFTYSDNFLFPLTGNGMMGLEVYDSRGYAVTELSKPLDKNKYYYVRFNFIPHYPKNKIFNWVYTNSIGATFNYRYKNITPLDNYFNDIPVAQYEGPVVRDTANWTRVSNKYFSDGEESYLVIGNFKDNIGTKIDKNGFFPAKPYQSFTNYFYIDDVIVSRFNPLPDSSILCLNETKILDAKFYDAKYLWSDGSTKRTLAVTKPGKYWVDAHIDDLIFSDTVVIIPEKDYKGLPTDTAICRRGPLVNLSISVDAQYKWSTGQTSKSISIGSAGKYTVTITTPQCTLQFTTDAKERECSCDFFTPNSFTPNDDGNNDTFKPFINCKIVTIENYRFSVFNRFGNMMFSTNKIDESWDGYYRGQPCSSDVYAWFVEYNTIIDGKTQYKRTVESGDVTIMR